MQPDHAAAFVDGLRRGVLPPGVTAHDPAEAARRFAVHRNNVTASLTRALAARFPVVEALVGAAFFAAMARDFIDADPPDSPLLFRYGARMPAFIARFPPAAALPWLACVARIEVARGEAFHAADAAPVAPARLAAAAAAGGDIRLTLHPSLRLLWSPHPAAAIWAAHQPGGDLRVTAAGPQAVLIGRRPDFAVATEPLDPADHALAAALAAHGSLARAAAAAPPGHDPAPLLARLIGHGLVTDARPGEPA